MKESSCKKKSAGVRFHGNLRVPSNESLEQYQIGVPCVDSTLHGNLQAPAQFAGLYSRSLEDFETPWEVVELVRFDDPADHPTPAPNAWLLAMEDWSSLNAKDRVWHYKSRSDDAFFFSVSSRPPLPAPALDRREAVVGNEGQFFFDVLTTPRIFRPPPGLEPPLVEAIEFLGSREWHVAELNVSFVALVCFTYYQTIETGLGDYFHYKPHPDSMNGSCHVDFPQ